MSKFDIITIGGAVRDTTFYTNQGKIFATPNNLTAQKMLGFEYGAKINIPEVYRNLGGGAANTAVSLSRLGFKTATITRIGNDEDGKNILSKFKKNKVNTNFVQLDNKVQTGFSCILSMSKMDREHIAFLHRGANENLILQTQKIKDLKTPWFYITSLSGYGWLKTLKQIMAFAKNKKIKIAWNPGNLQLQAGKKVLANFLKQTSVLILNKDEAIELVLSGIKIGKRDPKYLNRPLYLLNILRDWGPKTVVITDGKKGAWAYDGKTIYQQKIKKTKAVDTTGVGDAFGSSFIAGFINTKGNVEQSLKWGIANSASVIKKVGAQNGLLTLKELKKYV